MIRHLSPDTIRIIQGILSFCIGIVICKIAEELALIIVDRINKSREHLNELLKIASDNTKILINVIDNNTFSFKPIELKGSMSDDASKCGYILNNYCSLIDNNVFIKCDYYYHNYRYLYIQCIELGGKSNPITKFKCLLSCDNCDDIGSAFVTQYPDNFIKYMNNIDNSIDYDAIIEIYCNQIKRLNKIDKKLYKSYCDVYYATSEFVEDNIDSILNQCNN